MNHLSQQVVEDKAFLDEAAIRRIRLYIERKHPGFTSAQRAALLANAVHRSIDMRLPDFEEPVKVRLRQELLRRMGLEGRFALFSRDILEACTKLELEESGLQQLARWMEEHRLTLTELRQSRGQGQERGRRPEQGREQGQEREKGQGRERTQRPELVQERGHGPECMWVQGHGPELVQEPEEVWARLHVRIQAAVSLRRWIDMKGPAPGETALSVLLRLFRQTCRYVPVIPAVLTLALLSAASGSLPGSLASSSVVSIPSPAVSLAAEPASQQVQSPLPAEYSYRDVDRSQLRLWLEGKNSLLAEDLYLTAIIDAAEEYDIHPLLLFAITGQEQAYVPRDHKQADRIVNNPFNVYHSWQSFNTDIGDSARIAAKTIVSISQSRPADAHPIMWLNTRYAEDPKWWIGVDAIFGKMQREIEQASPPEMDH
ncbi:MAG: hypothetical protein K0R57_1405 [Paenibacillaceae bacterium]|jgi:hypothetical protein|nr:hypothetical protein [Paenibacillaceae bacterium]